MPLPLIIAYAKKARCPEAKVEQEWDAAKKKADGIVGIKSPSQREGNRRYWALVNGILKRSLGLSEAKTSFIETLVEETDAKLSFWELAKVLNVEPEAREIHDATLPWVNHNRRSAIDKLINNKKFQLVSQLKLYLYKVAKETNFGKQVLTLDGFKRALKHPLIIWRGGAGQYNLEYDERAWVSFTATRNRADTFSIYDGTVAQKVYKLPMNAKHWILELTIKLENALLYVEAGYDDEVIISAELAKKAKPIVVKE
jgi:hypothetical protein